MIFDQILLRKNRDRAAKNFQDFLFKEVADRIIEDLLDFDDLDSKIILEIGSRNGYLGQKIANIKTPELLIQSECSYQMSLLNHHHQKLVCDNELLSFQNNSVDLIISNLNFHFVNDVLKYLDLLKRILARKGRLFLTFFGPQTLMELKDAFLKSELEMYHGSSARIAPFIDVKTAGMLLYRVGFQSVVSQKDIIKVSYRNLMQMMQDIKNMGETNILLKKNKRFTSKKLLKKIEDFLIFNHSDLHKQINCTFEIITLTGSK